ncbi:hypothetical protein EVAR_69593_1 [Eumeta japonica]|uniref:Uncharacterized protein n=1 Tax=Eumeta variegata TaxID=151549 RepID=A0A4C2AE22_EUMVA|nr:hypothetical protein EVAR_69593_1 [Eumeta japonica]
MSQTSSHPLLSCQRAQFTGPLSTLPKRITKYIHTSFYRRRLKPTAAFFLDVAKALDKAHRPSTLDSHLQSPNTGTSRAIPAVPSDDLSQNPCLFEVPLGNRSKSFCDLSATLAARNASGYALKAFVLIVRTAVVKVEPDTENSLMSFSKFAWAVFSRVSNVEKHRVELSRLGKKYGFVDVRPDVRSVGYVSRW